MATVAQESGSRACGCGGERGGGAEKNAVLRSSYSHYRELSTGVSRQDGGFVHSQHSEHASPPISKLEVKSAEVRVADDPVYAKYFKMLKMGLPQDAVRHKMVMDEVNPKALELGQDAFVSQLQGAVWAAKTTAPTIKPKPRRKKLHWQPISDDRLSSINRQTIWEDKDDDVELDMDMAELESLFFASSDNKKKKATATQTKTMKRKQSVTLFDASRALVVCSGVHVGSERGCSRPTRHSSAR